MALVQAFGAAGEGVDPVVRAAKEAAHGDWQSNVAMSLARTVQKNPRETAAAIVEALAIDEICEQPEIAGPGFINFRVRTEYLAKQLEAMQTDERLGVARAARPQRVALDFSSPNLAKEMHVGHLRSTIIGESLARVLEFVGHEVIRINHVGDWGTQFGMLLQYVRETHPEALKDPESFHVSDLEAFYKQAKARFDADPAFAEAARRAVVELQSGDPATLTIWRAFCHESLRHCHEIYERLGVRVEDVGESFYNDMLAGVVKELERQGLVTTSAGAQCIFLEGFVNREGEPLPMIVRKSDGGYNYDTTDLAAVQHRVLTLGAQRLIYVVDLRQRQHFEMLFAAARKAGWADESVRLEHIGFGMVLGADRRPIKTRDGETIKLKSLLEEAEARALRLLEENEKNEETARGLSREEMARVARVVGTGAVRYADLSHNLASDYVFSWEKMLAMEGNTAPYMLYAYARIRSIGRKAGIEFDQLPMARIVLGHESEAALAKMLLRCGEVVGTMAEELRPNVMTEYLFELSKAFNQFYDRRLGVRVIDSETEELRLSRLRLCDLTARTLRLGLWMLGIEVLDRM